MEESYGYKPLKFFLVTNLIMWATWLIAAYFSYQQGSGCCSWARSQNA